MKKTAWPYEDNILAVGVSTKEDFEAMARAMQLLDEDWELDDIRAYSLPVAEYAKEQWDGSRMFPVEFDHKPGRGYIKVLIGEAVEK